MILSELSDEELLSHKKKIQAEISKYKNFQLAKKVGLNSVYGACGNSYFRFYDTRLAEAITLSGQLAILWTERKINEYMNSVLKTENVDYVIAIDTDSVYLTLDNLVNKLFKDQSDTIKIVNFVDKFCDGKLQEVIDSGFSELADYMNAYQKKLVMKRETIANKGIWTAKKRYILNVYDSEGVRYTTPHLKIMGNEAIRNSTPEVCRRMIKETFRLMLQDSKEATYKYIKECEKEFKNLPVEDVAFPRTVNGIKFYSDNTTVYKKGTPIHVRGCLLYNKRLVDLKLTKKYPTIKEGEKIRFVYLKEPNTIRENVISMIDKMPEEFDIQKYVDYDKQFEKTFLDPLSIIFDCIGWKIKQVSNLSGFFK